MCGLSSGCRGLQSGRDHFRWRCQSVRAHEGRHAKAAAFARLTPRHAAFADPGSSFSALHAASGTALHGVGAAPKPSALSSGDSKTSPARFRARRSSGSGGSPGAPYPSRLTRAPSGYRASGGPPPARLGGLHTERGECRDEEATAAAVEVGSHSIIWSARANSRRDRHAERSRGSSR